jgi:hypothetical protein
MQVDSLLKLLKFLQKFFVGILDAFSKKKIGSSLFRFINRFKKAERKVISMISHIASSKKGLLMTAILIASAIGLVACGGGGGGDSTSPVTSGGGTTTTVPVVPVTPVTPVKPVASGTLVATGCIVTHGQGTCNASATWTTTNATTPRVTVAGASISSLANATVAQTFSVNIGATAIALTDGATVLASSTVNAVCDSKSSVVAGLCQLTVLHYSELKLVVFADRGGYIGKVSSSGITPLVNNTSYTMGAVSPIALCGIWDKLLPSGRPLASCQTPAAGNIRRNFPIDPVTGSLEAEYIGQVPSGAVLHDVGYGVFGATPYAAQGVGNTGMYIDVTEGTYYFTNTDSLNLRLTSNGFVTNAVIGTGDFQYLTVFSN